MLIQRFDSSFLFLPAVVKSICSVQDLCFGCSVLVTPGDTWWSNFLIQDRPAITLWSCCCVFRFLPRGLGLFNAAGVENLDGLCGRIAGWWFDFSVNGWFMRMRGWWHLFVNLHTNICCCEEKGAADDLVPARWGRLLARRAQLTGEYMLTLRNICRNMNSWQILWKLKCEALAVEYEEYWFGFFFGLRS